MSLGTLEFEILNSIWKLQAIDEDMNISEIGRAHV